MPAPDVYLTLSGRGESQLTEKRSRFLSFAFPLTGGERQARDLIAQLHTRYHDARHLCFAYSLRAPDDVGDKREGPLLRQSDDGEPSGTAGRPLSLLLQRAGLTDALLCVVRYFGGVKLGTGPLAAAYRCAGAQALEQAGVRECVLTATVSVTAPYPDADLALRLARRMGARLLSTDYTDTGACLSLSIRAGEEQSLRKELGKFHMLKL